MIKRTSSCDRRHGLFLYAKTLTTLLYNCREFHFRRDDSMRSKAILTIAVKVKTEVVKLLHEKKVCFIGLKKGGMIL